MNTYPLYDSEGRVFAFEIEIVYIGLRKIATLLSLVHGVSNVHIRKLFSSPTDVHVEFHYGGQEFVVWEPYADSSRYWIGQKDEDREHIDVRELECVFRRYQPPIIIKVLGDFISLKFLSAFKR